MRDKFYRMIKITWMNKVVSLLLTAVGYSTVLIDRDATAFVFVLMITIPLFFAKRNYILW